MDNLKDRGAALANTFAMGAIPVLTVLAATIDKIPTPVLAAGIAIVTLAVGINKLSGAFALFNANPMLIALAAVSLALVELLQHAQAVQDFFGRNFGGIAKTIVNALPGGGGFGNSSTSLTPNAVAIAKASGISTKGASVMTVNQNVVVQASNPFDLSKSLARTANQATRSAGR